MPSPRAIIVEFTPMGEGPSVNAGPVDLLQPLRVEYRSGQTLAQAVYLSGLLLPPALCSGLAHCGRCRVRILASEELPLSSATPDDMRVFSPGELAQGWRLGCHHRPVPGLRVELPDGTRLFGESIVQQRELAGREQRRQDALYPAAAVADSRTAASALAVDLGTTSLQWLQQTAQEEAVPEVSPGDLPLLRMYEPPLWQGSTINPQMGAGSDVISRLAVAQTTEGKAQLSALVLASLQALVESAGSMTPSGKVTALCLAANTAMTYIALGMDTTGLAFAPYSLSYTGGIWEDIPGLPPVWIPPQLSPFVGGDISAGYAAIALDPQVRPPEYPFLLADLGTNGEFLLALSPDTALVASVALGPALEGIGLSHGTDARAFAITDFFLTPKGLEAHFLADNTTAQSPALPRHLESSPRSLPSLVVQEDLPLQVRPSLVMPPQTPLPGITGTGYIALLQILLKSGAMDRAGHFTPAMAGPLRRFLTPSEGREAFLPLPYSMRLTATDVEETLKVKAAFSLGLHRLLDAAGLASRDLARVYIAGALGRYVNKEALEELGFFPQGMASRMEAAGNTSLAGAALLLRQAKVRTDLIQWAARVQTVDLASDTAFMQEFPNHMRFSW